MVPVENACSYKSAVPVWSYLAKRRENEQETESVCVLLEVPLTAF